jgi:hypothetical protein
MLKPSQSLLDSFIAASFWVTIRGAGGGVKNSLLFQFC